MNALAVCLWLVIGGALLRVGWETVGRLFEFVLGVLADRRIRRRRALVASKDHDPHI